MKQFVTVRKRECLALLCATLTSLASADVIYETYTPGVTGISGSQPVFRTVAGQSAYQVGGKFIASQDYLLTTATLNVARSWGAVSDLQLTLRSDQAGLPGVILGTFNNPASIGSTPGDYAFTSSLSIEAGQFYWLVASPNLSADSWFEWSTIAGNLPTASSAYNSATSDWYAWTPIQPYALAFQVSGELIPEPSCLALFLTAGIFFVRKHARRS